MSDTPADLKELAEEAARQWMQTFAHPGALSLERIIEGYLLRQKADFEARIGALRHLSEQDKAELAEALKAKEERVPICQAAPLTVSRAIWDTAWLAYSKAHGGGQAQHDRLLRDGFYAGELDQFCPGWRPIDQRITTLEKAKEEAERTADITMTGFGKLEEKFREQVLRAEKAERDAQALKKWVVYKPFNSYLSCRVCGGTWWPEEYSRHRSDCLVVNIADKAMKP